QTRQEVNDTAPHKPDNTPPVAAPARPGIGVFRCAFAIDDSISPASCRYADEHRRRIREHFRLGHRQYLVSMGGHRSAAVAEEEKENDDAVICS
ncbi:hypothetical protein CMEL01_16785, partial [Colletotrichum melonis]